MAKDELIFDTFGIDIGGSGIKGSPADLRRGERGPERRRVPTPDPATPQACAQAVAEIADYFSWKKPFGITFPGVVQNNVIQTAANMDKSWIGVDAGELFSDAVGAQAYVVNDADAAGLAVVAYGVGHGVAGTVLVVTLGTGIGSALFVDEELVPNTELGHIEMNGADAETQAAARVKDDEGLSWAQWGKRVNQYLHTVEDLIWPDLIVIGGGVSKHFHDHIEPYLDVRSRIIPAQLRNDAGIVGAALYAERRQRRNDG